MKYKFLRFFSLITGTASMFLLVAPIYFPSILNYIDGMDFFWRDILCFFLLGLAISSFFLFLDAGDSDGAIRWPKVLFTGFHFYFRWLGKKQLHKEK